MCAVDGRAVVESNCCIVAFVLHQQKHGRMGTEKGAESFTHLTETMQETG